MKKIINHSFAYFRDGVYGDGTRISTRNTFNTNGGEFADGTKQKMVERLIVIPDRSDATINGLLEIARSDKRWNVCQSGLSLRWLGRSYASSDNRPFNDHLQ